MAKANQENSLEELDLDIEYDDWYWRMVEREELERMDEEFAKDCGVDYHTDKG